MVRYSLRLEMREARRIKDEFVSACDVIDVTLYLCQGLNWKQLLNWWAGDRLRQLSSKCRLHSSIWSFPQKALSVIPLSRVMYESLCLGHLWWLFVTKKECLILMSSDKKVFFFLFSFF